VLNKNLAHKLFKLADLFEKLHQYVSFSQSSLGSRAPPVCQIDNIIMLVKMGKFQEIGTFPDAGLEHQINTNPSWGVFAFECHN